MNLVAPSATVVMASSSVVLRVASTLSRSEQHHQGRGVVCGILICSVPSKIRRRLLQTAMAKAGKREQEREGESASITHNETRDKKKEREALAIAIVVFKQRRKTQKGARNASSLCALLCC